MQLFERSILSYELSRANIIHASWTDWKIKNWLAKASQTLLYQIQFLVLDLDVSYLENSIGMLSDILRIWTARILFVRVFILAIASIRSLHLYLILWRYLRLLFHHGVFKILAHLLKTYFDRFKQSFLIGFSNNMPPNDESHLQNRERIVFFIVLLLNRLIQIIQYWAHLTEFLIQFLQRSWESSPLCIVKLKKLYCIFIWRVVIRKNWWNELALAFNSIVETFKDWNQNFQRASSLRFCLWYYLIRLILLCFLFLVALNFLFLWLALMIA